MNGFKFLKDQWILIVFWFIGLGILNLVLILDPNQTFNIDNLIYVSLLLTVFFLFLLVDSMFIILNGTVKLKKNATLEKMDYFHS